MSLDRQQIIVIEPRKKWYDWGIKELAQYKDLIFLFIKRDLKLQYKQTALGPVWLFLGPLATAIIYAIVFGQLAGLSTDGIPHILFYVTGVNFWMPFAACITAISNSLLNNMHLFGKVYFPRLALPVAISVEFITNFFFMFAVTLAFYIYFILTGEVQMVQWTFLLIPVLVIHGAIVALSIGLIVAGLTTRYRDLGLAINYLMTGWMFATPIVYSLSTAYGWMRTILLLNPLTSIVCNFRYALTGAGTFLVQEWIFSLGLTFVLLITGLTVFSQAESTFIDTV